MKGVYLILLRGAIIYFGGRCGRSGRLV